MQASIGAGMAEALRDRPTHRFYLASARTPEGFPRLLAAMSARTPAL